MNSMRALTVPQPGASLLASGVTGVVALSWMAPKEHWGTTVAIHAAEREWRWQDFEGNDRLIGALRGLIMPQKSLRQSLPLGALIATATLVECLRVWAHSSYGTPFVQEPNGERRIGFFKSDDGLGDSSVGRWVWVLSDAKKLDEPIPIRGHQGLWTMQQPIGQAG